MIKWDAGPSVGPQCSRGIRAAMHHGSKKSACKNTPPVKCATRKTSDNASILTFLSGSGVSVIPPGVPAIASRSSADLQMPASADRLSTLSAQLCGRRRAMNAIDKISASDRYARCVQTSKRVRWDIDEDIIRGRSFDTAHKFLPDGLWLGDQVALDALGRVSDEELKHQALFRRIDAMVGEVLPDGYRFDIDPNAVAHVVLGKST